MDHDFTWQKRGCVSFGECTANACKVIHPADEIRSQTFLQDSFNVYLLSFVLKKPVHSSGQIRDVLHSIQLACGSLPTVRTTPAGLGEHLSGWRLILFLY
jgi:hypothetical protein